MAYRHVRSCPPRARPPPATGAQAREASKWPKFGGLAPLPMFRRSAEERDKGSAALGFGANGSNQGALMSQNLNRIRQRTNEGAGFFSWPKNKRPPARPRRLGCVLVGTTICPTTSHRTKTCRYSGLKIVHAPRLAARCRVAAAHCKITTNGRNPRADRESPAAVPVRVPCAGIEGGGAVPVSSRIGILGLDYFQPGGAVPNFFIVCPSRLKAGIQKEIARNCEEKGHFFPSPFFVLAPVTALP